MYDLFVSSGIKVYIVCIFMISQFKCVFLCMCQFHNFVGIVSILFSLYSQFD